MMLIVLKATEDLTELSPVHDVYFSICCYTQKPYYANVIIELKCEIEQSTLKESFINFILDFN